MSIQDPHTVMPGGKRKYYLNNSTILPEVIRAKSLGHITNELAQMFQLITSRFARHPSFSGYTFIEDMKAFAVANLCANGLKFDTVRFANPFNYYTTAIYHSFLQYIAEEKKQRNIRDMLLIEHGANPSNTMTDANHDDFLSRHSDLGSDANISNSNGNEHSHDATPARVEEPRKSRNYGVGGKTKAKINERKAKELAEQNAYDGIEPEIEAESPTLTPAILEY